MMGVFYWATDAPLDDLIIAAQAEASDDSSAMDAILSRFKPLVLSIGRSLTRDWSYQDDAAQGARLGLVKAVRGHKVGTHGFPAYAKRYMYGSALRQLQAMQSSDTCVDPMDFDWADTVPRDAAPPDTTFEVVDLVSVLTPEQQAVTVAYYIDDLRLDDIAVVLNISKPAVSQRLNTIHRTLRPVVEMAVAA